jgi:hypothetical protein
VQFGNESEKIMKSIAIFAPDHPGEMAGVNAPPLPGVPLSPAPSPAAQTTSGATARQAARENGLSPVKSDSVVSKVAQLLIHRGQDLRLGPPIRWEDSYVRQKVLMSLQAK